jgi:type IV pilus assembly protein PilY1
MKKSKLLSSVIFAGLTAVSGFAYSAQTDISSTPLITGGAQPVLPNIMLLLDDSGSMEWQFMPDNVLYVPAATTTNSVNCRSSSGGMASCGGTPNRGSRTSVSPPVDAKEFNTIAYNPAIRYLPPIDYNGTNTTFKNFDNSASPWLWTAVANDLYLASQNMGTYNVQSGYLERWWCNGSKATASDPINCRQNGAKIALPAMAGTVSSTSFASNTMTVTVSANMGTAAGSMHGCAPGDLVTISGLSVASANGPFHISAVNSGSTTFNYTYSTTVSTNKPANGATLSVTPCIQTFPVSSLTASSTTATLTRSGSTGNGQTGCYPGDTVTVAGASIAAYNGSWSVATASGSTLTYTTTTAPGGSAANATGTVMTFSACNIPMAQLAQTAGVATATYLTAHGCNVGDTITVTGASGAGGYNITATVTSVPATNQLTYTVGSSLASPATRALTAVPIRSTLCPGTRLSYSTSSDNVPPLMQGFPMNASNSASNFTTQSDVGGNPYYYTIYSNEWCTTQDMTKCDSAFQTSTNSFSAEVRFCVNSTTQAAAVGTSATTSTSPTTGCQRVFTSNGQFQRPRYGYFVRSDITNAGWCTSTARTSCQASADAAHTVSQTTYTRASTRTDCVAEAGLCRFEEEMTNFSDWYAYYRVRTHMAKAASGRAFHELNPTNLAAGSVGYRVGLTTTNNGATLDAAPFAGDTSTGQKAQWFTALYGVDPNGGTPLRQALARVGRYYAGNYKTSTPYNADPMEYSCQQNFVVATTDGFWNGSGGVKLDGSTAVGDQDGGATVPRPLFDSSATATADNAGTLADVAYYYYFTDLRTATNNPNGNLGSDVSTDNVPPTGADTATWQHMTTFTMGLGLDSTLVWAPGYATQGTSSDYNALVNGTKNWPIPLHDDITAVDDLWHAAVNGHGLYFSAKDPDAVIAGLQTAFAGIKQRTGTDAAAATSNPNIVSGDNFLFASTFVTIDWTGDLTRQTIDIQTGAISPTIDWSAMAQLDLQVSATSDTRSIWTFSAGAATKLRSFLWGNLTTTEQGYFAGTLVPHYSLLDPTTQQSQLNCAGCGQKVVNFIRGQRGFEGANNDVNVIDPNPNALFRARTHVLGDIVSAEAVYVKTPRFGYGDPGYSTFSSAGVAATRQAMVYVAANDGMLHGFDAGTGNEVFAYIPTIVMPNLIALTGKQYGTNHKYYVDGTPTVGDVCTANCTNNSTAVWKTILVGGLNDGGRAFYALDITDPANPKGLWEFNVGTTCIPNGNGIRANTPVDPVNTATGAPFFSDCDIGFSFGNPIITKRNDGRWVVLLTSGYNNVSPGTGGGFLYILDANTGEILEKIGTMVTPVPSSPTLVNAGNTTTPSGFTRINSFATNSDADNTSLRVYGGDLNGNLWRIDNNNIIDVNGNTAKLLAIFGGQAPSTSGTVQGDGTQPITEKPELGEINANGSIFEIVYVGTGRFLGASDQTAAAQTQQSFYAVKDPLTVNPGWGVFRSLISGGTVVQQTMTTISGTTNRTTTATAVNFLTAAGWVIDFNPGNTTPGERSYTDPTLQLGTLAFTTNVPSTGANRCIIGGTSFVYFLDYTTGGPVAGSNGVSGQFLGNALATRPVMVRLASNKVISLIRLGTGQTLNPPTPVGSSGAGGKRILWREINTDF